MVLGCFRHAVEGEAQVNSQTYATLNTTLELGPNTVDMFAGGSVLLTDTKDQHMVYLMRGEAIELAKAILLKNDVPFCNRVRGAGVETEAKVD